MARVREYSHLGLATSIESSSREAPVAKDRFGTMEELPALSIVWRASERQTQTDTEQRKEEDSRAKMETKTEGGREERTLTRIVRDVVLLCTDFGWVPIIRYCPSER